MPTRQTLIGKNKVEEYDWPRGNDTAVYINGKWIRDETYDEVVKRLEESLDIT